MVVHPAPAHEEGTLVNAMLASFPELADPTGAAAAGHRPSPRQGHLGAAGVGKTAAAVAALQEQLKGRSVSKSATRLLVHGLIAEKEG